MAHIAGRENHVCGREPTGQCKGLLGACYISCKAQKMQEV